VSLLLDTHALLWWLDDDPALGDAARAAVADPGRQVYVSAATVWEVGIKARLGKLRAPAGLLEVLAEEGFVGLPMALEHAEAAARLPMHHRDPFDRMLVAQAHALSLVLVTHDRRLEAYGGQFLWV
jgi:PIN domain nuclease of toxin-antitoxin system